MPAKTRATAIQGNRPIPPNVSNNSGFDNPKG